MALTKDDLQAIREIVRGEVHEEVAGQMAPIREIVRGEVHEEVAGQMAAIREIVRGEVHEEVADQMAPIRESVTKLEALPRQVAAIAEGQTATHDRLDHMQTQVDSVEKKLENSMVIKAVTP